MGAPPEHARTREVIEASWERLFDPIAPLDPWYGPLETVQAIFETLWLADVTDVTPFRARIAVRNLPRPDASAAAAR